MHWTNRNKITVNGYCAGVAGKQQLIMFLCVVCGAEVYACQGVLLCERCGYVVRAHVLTEQIQTPPTDLLPDPV